MNIDKYLSDKLKLISFVSMLMVVFLHSYNLGTEIIENPNIKRGYNFFVQFFISQGITRIAVPIFFTISGYLLFIRLNNINIFKEYIPILKKRFISLAVPYLIWSFSFFMFFLLLQKLPGIATLFKQKHIADYSISETLSVIFINPIPFQLWFIRDLILLIVIFPLLYWVLQLFKGLALLLFLISWWFGFDFIVFSNEALLFFAFGSFLGINKSDLKVEINQITTCFLISLWLLIVLCETLLVYKSFSNLYILNFLHKSGILIGVISVWFFYDFILKNKYRFYFKSIPFLHLSFFIYAFHEPLLEILKIIFYKILGTEQTAMFSIYIVAPLIVIALCILTGEFLKKKVPSFFKIITGGR
ncbi:acyltransferase family protein [Flavobacterium sharifuzzamanii]|uniref:acyltransferase family protein n=1 Tax=Flavobacterium sharifuzzamanii TaxID=2211133 RepID=UPI000DAC4076|nr:acyltransferase [Flavobacterium sharifuzzamanii]KAF2081157.1 acyltransferase [Flavobacterium sharifuzzamanii]